MVRFNIVAIRRLIGAFRAHRILWMQVHPSLIGQYPYRNRRTAAAWNAVGLAMPGFTQPALRRKMKRLLAIWQILQSARRHRWIYARDFAFLDELKAALNAAQLNGVAIVAGRISGSFDVLYRSQYMLATYKSIPTPRAGEQVIMLTLTTHPSTSTSHTPDTFHFFEIY